jgi:phage/plasmid-associated DNA primase
VIPFNAKIIGNDDIKNYSEYLFDNAAESVLGWIIEGAKKVIDANYKLKVPRCVADAIQAYREQNDWFHHFFEDCLIADAMSNESSSKLYTRYRNYCLQMNEFIRSTTDFYFALEKAGYERFVKHNSRFFKGIRIKDDVESDFI